MVGNRLRGKKLRKVGLEGDKALIAGVMDDTHLGRHGAGKTSAFTCHETQRQYAAYNRKNQLRLSSLSDLLPRSPNTLEGRNGEAGKELVEKTRDEKAASQFRNYCNKDFTSNSCRPLISS